MGIKGFHVLCFEEKIHIHIRGQCAKREQKISHNVHKKYDL